MSTIFADVEFSTNAIVSLGDQVAHHARVRRLAAGNAVQLSNGRGSIAAGEIAAIKKNSVDVMVDRIRRIPKPAAIHLRAPIADRDRMLLLAEKATELGIASWQSVKFQRSTSVSPRGEGPGFAEKLRARMISALEQSGGAWLPEILEETRISSIHFSNEEIPIVLATSGDPLSSLALGTNGKAPVVLVGPEGGIEADEMRRLSDAGWRPVRLARNTLRFETAGIAAVAAIRATGPSEEE